MASGYGLNGGVSRCYPYWQDFLACYVVNTSSSGSDAPSLCGLQKSDYYECLHHHKEIAKTKAIRAAYLRRIENGVAESGSPGGGNAGDAKSIGVLSK